MQVTIYENVWSFTRKYTQVTVYETRSVREKYWTRISIMEVIEISQES